MTDARLARQSVRVLVKGVPDVREARVSTKALVDDVPTLRESATSVQVLLENESNVRLSSESAQVILRESPSNVRLSASSLQVIKKNYLPDNTGNWGISEVQNLSGVITVNPANADASVHYQTLPMARANEGDMLVLVATCYDAGREPTGITQAGYTWTPIRDTGNFIRAWYCFPPNLTSPTVVVNQLNNSGSHGSHMMLLRGVPKTSPIDVAAVYTDHGAITSMAVPAITTIDQKSIVFSCVTSTDDNTWSITEPGWTLVASTNHTGLHASAIAYKIQGPGSSGTQAWTHLTGGSDNSRSMIFALKLAY